MVCCMDVVFIAFKILSTLVWRSVLEAPYSYGHHPSTNTHALYKEYIEVLKVSSALELWQPQTINLAMAKQCLGDIILVNSFGKRSDVYIN